MFRTHGNYANDLCGMTIKTRKVEKLPPEEHARYKCNDCDDNVLDVGDWYLANPDIWRGLGLEWDDNLCIPCLQKRLGAQQTAITALRSFDASAAHVFHHKLTTVNM
jgi:hypothetical protein